LWLPRDLQSATEQDMQTAQSEQSVHGAISGGDVLRAVWRRKWLIAAVTIVLTVMNVGVALMLPKLYRAEVLLQADPRGGRLVEGNVTSLPNELDGGGLAGQVDVIRSPDIALRVIASEGLEEQEEFSRELDREGEATLSTTLRGYVAWMVHQARQVLPGGASADFAPPPQPPLTEEYRRREDAIRILQRNLQVDYDLRGASLRIRYISEDPALAASVANAVALAYVDHQMERKLDLLRNATQWLSERLEGLRTKAVEAESRMAEFRQRHDLGTTEAPVFTQQQLADLHAQLITAIGIEAEAEARARRAEAAARANQLGGIPEAINSPTVQRLREQEVITSRRLAELNSDGNLRTASTVRAELAQVSRRINEELGRVLESLRGEAEVTRARRTSIEATIARLTSAAVQRDSYSVQAAQLEREAVANRAVFDAAVRRMEEARTLDGLQRPDVSVVSPALVPARPYKPRLELVAGLGFAGSLFAGLGLATLIELRRRTLRSLAQGETALGIHGIGWTPALRLRRGEQPEDIVLREPTHLFSECLRSITVGLRTAGGRSSRVILVTSALPAEGKTTLALSYTRMAAAAGQSCLLIEADLRRPTFNKRLGAEPHHGLSDLVGGRKPRLGEVVQRDEASGADFIVAGEDGGDPLRALDKVAFGAFIEQARDCYDTIVIDAPPILAVADGAMLVQHADVVLLVVRWDRTPVRLAAQALGRIRRAGAENVAFVLSQIDTARLPRDQDERQAIDYAYRSDAPKRQPKLRVVGGGERKSAGGGAE
jgi:capsular exopolysaccharide synthesis family protein